MIVLPASILLELHKLTTNSTNLMLLEIPEHSLQYVHNTENIVWDGKTWLKGWFQFGDIDDMTTDRVPELTIQTSNIGGAMEREILAHDNFEDSTCILRIVNSSCLSETTPIFQVAFQIMKPIVSRQIAALRLSAENPLLLSYPSWHYHASLCQYTGPTGSAFGFKGAYCHYAGLDAACDRTLIDCLSKSNVKYFGAQLGLSDDYVDLDA